MGVSFIAIMATCTGVVRRRRAVCQRGNHFSELISNNALASSNI